MTQTRAPEVDTVPWNTPEDIALAEGVLMQPSNFVKGLAVGLLAGACWLVSAPLSQAQSVFCPASLPASAGGFAVDNGACTNGQTGSFSGAALASQALSSLSQTATQETTQSTATSVTNRRNEEEQRCAEGFTRVDGDCRRVPPPVAETEPVAPPAVPSVRPAPREAAPRKAAVTAIPHGEAHAAPARGAVLPERLPPAPVPVPIEPAARFGAWTQVYGDYEKRNATSPANVLCCVINNDFSALPLSVNVQSRTGTVGFQAGLDLTTRGLIFNNDGLIAGALVGYLSSDLTLNSAGLSSDFSKALNEFAHLRANLSGPTLGLYATYFDNGFSADFLFKVDILHLNETFQDSLAFCACIDGIPGQSSIVPISGNGSVNLVNSTLAGNLNYRFPVTPSLWIEPTVGAQYTLTSYGSDAGSLGLSDGSLVRVQGGARVGMPVWLNSHTLMTTTVTGLAYSDVLVSGGFIPGAGFAAGNILAQADQGQVRGRGVVAATLDYGNGVISFIQGEVRGGQGLIGAGGRAGIRIVW